MNKVTTAYKNAYSGLAPSTWWLSLVMLVNRMGTMVVPFMTLYLTQSMGFSIAQAGWVFALFGAGAVCGGFLGGKLSDKFGFYYIQITALVGGGIMFLILGQMRSYPLICVFTFLLSLVNDAFRPANSAAIAHYSSEENRTRSYSLNRLAINLGWALGGALGGFIASHNYHLLFWIDGFTNIGAAFLLWAFLAPSKNKATRVKEHIRDISERPAYKDKAFMVFVILTVMYAYCFFQLFSTMPVFYRKELHLKEYFIGIVMAMNGVIIAFFEMILIHRLEGKRHNLLYVCTGVSLLGISFIMFNLLPPAGWVAVVSMLFVTIGEMLSMPFMNSYWISRTGVTNRGQYAGLYTVAWSAAQVLGPGTGAQIAEYWGFNALWWVTGVICLVTVIGFRWLKNIS